jgi:hypothetical protein
VARSQLPVSQGGSDMAARIVKLTDLIETGRGATRAQEVHATSSRSTEVRTTAAVINGIELLAIELLSLTKTRRDNPRALMVDALRSIDSCLVAIAGKG